MNGVDHVNKEEKQKMVEEAMEADGLIQDQANKKTGQGGIFLCSAVTSGTTVGTAAKAMQAMEAKEAFQRKKVKRSAAQHENMILRTQLDETRRKQVDSFLARWNKEGLAAVSEEEPVKQGDPGMHAWDTMLKAYLDPNNRHLADISEELTKYDLSAIMKKKDGDYLVAMINVVMMRRCENFLGT